MFFRFGGDWFTQIARDSWDDECEFGNFPVNRGFWADMGGGGIGILCDYGSGMITLVSGLALICLGIFGQGRVN